MPDREARIRQFLGATGWAGAVRRPLAGDASFRRYERLEAGARRAVLMDAPPPREDVRPYLALARHLRALGFSAPEVFAVDEGAGLVLLEDLGDATYTRMLDEGADERALYERAVDLLVDLHRRPHAELALPGIPPYDDDRLLGEAVLLVDWYLPAVTGERVAHAVRRDYVAAWRSCFPLARAVPETLVLRDYHVDNLMWLAGRDGVAGCGILDFQDGVVGPVAYDLVSLLEDARRDIAPALEAGMKARYLAAFPDLDAGAFETAYAVLGAQRNCKIIGIFTRLSARDGKPAYLAHIPRVFRLLERDLERAELAPVKGWIDRNLPQRPRVAPRPLAGKA